MSTDNSRFAPMSEDLFDGIKGAKAHEAMCLVFGGGDWFKFSKKLLAAMSEPQALLVSFLVNFSSSRDVQGYMAANDGWFFCTARTICLEFLWSRDKQTDIVNALAKKGFIRTKVKGVPPKRHIQIDAEFLLREVARKWNEKMQEFSQLWGISNCGKNPAIGCGENPANHIEENELRELPPSLRSATRNSGSGEGDHRKNGKSPPKKFEFGSDTKDKADEYTAKYLEALRKKRILVDSARPEKWPAVFRKNLKKMTPAQAGRVDKVFSWFLTVVGGDSIPQAWSADSFFKEFHQIEKRFICLTGDDGRAEERKIRVTFVEDDGED